MPIIKIFYGAYCHGEEISQNVAQKMGYELLDDKYVVCETAKRFDVSENKLWRALAGKISAFNNFTLERERNVSCLKMSVAEIMSKNNFVLTGSAGLLIPPDISHVLRVCVIAEAGYRLEQVMKESSATKKEAQKIINKEDESKALWTNYLLKKDPWDAELYDILIPTSKTSTEDAVKIVCEHARSAALAPTSISKQAAKDFLLAAQVEVELGKSGHDVLVSAKDGTVTLTINKHTLMLSSLEYELKKAVMKVKGVKNVKTEVGPGFYQGTAYRRLDAELPSKVLLVDDEREFVQTLSERLLMRDLGSAVVYDGEEALSLVDEEEPEVMVLDLKMPGIDGFEVLRRVKLEHPNVEIIVLTGHGSEKDKEICMELGAFAYLQKPVDIEKLSSVMKQAYAKAKDKDERS